VPGVHTVPRRLRRRPPAHRAIHLLDATRSLAACRMDNDLLVKLLQASVDDEKSFGVISNPALPVRRMGKPGLNRSVGPIPS
jgi:hypothetical protein